MLVGSGLHHWFPKTHHLNVQDVVHSYPNITFLTHPCPVSPLWPASVAKLLPQPVLVIRQAQSLLQLLTFLLFCEIFQKWSKKNAFLLFYLLQNSEVLAVAILSVLASTTWLVQLIAKKGSDDKSNKRFLETGLDTTCEMSLPHQSICHLSHQSLRATGPC